MTKDEIEKQNEIIRKIVAESQKQGLDPDFGLAVAGRESDYRHIPSDDTNSTAFGPFQVNKATAKTLGYDYSDIVNNPDVAIEAGIANLVRHAKNPTFEGDPARIAAAHHWGEGHGFARHNDPIYLDQKDAAYLADIGEVMPGGAFPHSVFNATEKKQDVNPTSTKLSEEPWSVTHSGFGDLNNLQQSLITGGAGALMGGAAGAAKQPVLNALAYFMTPRDQGQSANRVEPSMESTAPANATSSPWQPPQQQAVTPKPQQSPVARQFQGKADETGNTGRANQTAYNTTTAAQTARTNRQKQIAASMGIDPNAPLIEYPEVASTESGILAPRDVVEQQQQEHAQEQKTQANRQATAAQIENNRQTKVINEVGRQAQAMFARAAELEKVGQSGIANALREKAMEIYKNGLPLPDFMKSLPGRMATIGGGLGAAIPTAVHQYQEGDNSGALKTLGIGAGTGALLSALPEQVVRPLNALSQGYDALSRARTGDYLGSAISTAGAAAPFVAGATNPIGWGVAAGAPLTNAAIEHTRELRKQRLTDPTAQGGLPDDVLQVGP